MNWRFFLFVVVLIKIISGQGGSLLIIDTLNSDLTATDVVANVAALLKLSRKTISVSSIQSSSGTKYTATYPVSAETERIISEPNFEESVKALRRLPLAFGSSPVFEVVSEEIITNHRSEIEAAIAKAVGIPASHVYMTSVTPRQGKGYAVSFEARVIPVAPAPALPLELQHFLQILQNVDKYLGTTSNYASAAGKTRYILAEIPFKAGTKVDDLRPFQSMVDSEMRSVAGSPLKSMNWFVGWNSIPYRQYIYTYNTANIATFSTPWLGDFRQAVRSVNTLNELALAVVSYSYTVTGASESEVLPYSSKLIESMALALGGVSKNDVQIVEITAGPNTQEFDATVQYRLFQSESASLALGQSNFEQTLNSEVAKVDGLNALVGLVTVVKVTDTFRFREDDVNFYSSKIVPNMEAFLTSCTGSLQSWRLTCESVTFDESGRSLHVTVSGSEENVKSAKAETGSGVGIYLGETFGYLFHREQSCSSTNARTDCTFQYPHTFFTNGNYRLSDITAYNEQILNAFRQAAGMADITIKSTSERFGSSIKYMFTIPHPTGAQHKTLGILRDAQGHKSRFEAILAGVPGLNVVMGYVTTTKAPITVPYLNVGEYSNPTQEAAEAKCNNIGMSLCSKTQLYKVVFDHVDGHSRPDLCYSGWTSEGEAGWYHKGEGCGGLTGWQTWNPPNPGAHCCTEFDGYTTTTAAPQDAQIYFTTGYEHSNLQSAKDACTNEYPGVPLTICTLQQVIGIAKWNQQSGGEYNTCINGWVDDGSVTGTKGVWVADGQNCMDGNPGWKTASTSSGKYAAHCCLPSYMSQDKSALTESATFESSIAFCQSQRVGKSGIGNVHYDVCTKTQLRSISQVEQTNICQPGYVRDNDVLNVGLVGYYQGQSVSDPLCATPGRFAQPDSWPITVSHCCAPYVIPYTLVRASDAELEVYPESYRNGFTTGSAAEQTCVDLGYSGLCTTAQVVGFIQNGHTPNACKSGWFRSDTGVFTKGFLGYSYKSSTGADAQCGQAGEFSTWAPTTPVAFCCMDTLLGQTSNIPYLAHGEYVHTTMEAAAQSCPSGYNLCSSSQLYKVAFENVNGVSNRDICYTGWLVEGVAGWWQQSSTGCGGQSGWRSWMHNGKAGAHCCTSFLGSENVGVIDSGKATTAPPIVKSSFNLYVKDEAHVGMNGGLCTCPDGAVYKVGDYSNCGALACEGGISSQCRAGAGEHSHYKVICSSGMRSITILFPGFTKLHFQGLEVQVANAFRTALRTTGPVTFQSISSVSNSVEITCQYHANSVTSYSIQDMEYFTARLRNSIDQIDGITIFTKNIDCKGSWSYCNSDCEQTFTVSTFREGAGKTCDFSHGNTRRCEEGACLLPNQNCRGYFSPCGADCRHTWTKEAPATGSGTCAYTDREVVYCSAGVGECPINKDCVFSITSCSAECSQIASIHRVETGRGKCPYSHNQEILCSGFTDSCQGGQYDHLFQGVSVNQLIVYEKRIMQVFASATNVQDLSQIIKNQVISASGGNVVWSFHYPIYTATRTYVENHSTLRRSFSSLMSNIQGLGVLIGEAYDCSGVWRGCGSNCEDTWVQTRAAAGTGTCSYTDGQTRVCQAGEGSCPSNTNCVAAFTTCGVNCMKTWIVSVPRSGSGTCRHQHGHRETCPPDTGLCPANINCAGRWSRCSNSCRRTYVHQITQSGKGDHCSVADGTVEECGPDTDDCEANEDCVYKYSRCGTDCISHLEMVKGASGTGTCDHEASRVCAEGVDDCPLQPLDCEGHWTRCDSMCLKRYVHTRNARGDGDNSCAAHGTVKFCLPGFGGCPDLNSPVTFNGRDENCEGTLSECDEGSCQVTWTETKSKSGSGTCDYTDKEKIRCPNDPLNACTNTENCEGNWGRCGSDCKRIWTLTKPGNNNGTCDYINGNSYDCDGGTDECIATPIPSQAPSSYPTSDVCPYLLLDAPTLTNPYFGVYRKLGAKSESKYTFQHMDTGSILQRNIETWILEDATNQNNLFSMGGYDPALDTSVTPPTDMSWDYIVGSVATPVTGVQVSCHMAQPYQISGVVTNLAPKMNLLLTIGTNMDFSSISQTPAHAGANTVITVIPPDYSPVSFKFYARVWEGSTWSVTAADPTHANCQVTQGSGSNIQADVSDVIVDCIVITKFDFSGSLNADTTHNKDRVSISNGNAKYGHTLQWTSTGGAGFNFPRLEASAPYNVTAVGEGRTCVATNAVGQLTGDKTDLNIDCTEDMYTVSGTLTGLTTSDVVVLSWEGQREMTLTEDDNFNFPGTYPHGIYYLFKITQSPDFLNCHVTNNAKGRLKADKSDLEITCTPIDNKFYQLEVTLTRARACLNIEGIALNEIEFYDNDGAEIDVTHAALEPAGSELDSTNVMNLFDGDMNTDLYVNILGRKTSTSCSLESITIKDITLLSRPVLTRLYTTHRSMEHDPWEYSYKLCTYEGSHAQGCSTWEFGKEIINPNDASFTMVRKALLRTHDLFSYSVSVKVSGYSNALLGSSDAIPLGITNNDNTAGDQLSYLTDGTSSFGTQVKAGGNYDVKVVSQPSDLTCYKDTTPFSGVITDDVSLHIHCRLTNDATTGLAPAQLVEMTQNGFPLYLTDKMQIVNNEWHWSGRSTCVGAGDNEVTCSRTALVCAGILEFEYGTIERQVTLLLQAMKTTSSCVANGDICTNGGLDSCCHPDYGCYWTKIVTNEWQVQCMAKSDCNSNFNAQGCDQTYLDNPNKEAAIKHIRCPKASCASSVTAAYTPVVLQSEIEFCDVDGKMHVNGWNSCVDSSSGNLEDDMDRVLFEDYYFGTNDCTPQPNYNISSQFIVSEYVRPLDFLNDDHIHVLNKQVERISPNFTLFTSAMTRGDCCAKPNSTVIDEMDSTLQFFDSEFPLYYNSFPNSVVESMQNILDLLDGTLNSLRNNKVLFP